MADSSSSYTRIFGTRPGNFGTRPGNFGTRPEILALDQEILALDQEIQGKSKQIQKIIPASDPNGKFATSLGFSSVRTS